MIKPQRLSECFQAHAAAMVLYARQWLDRAVAEDAVQEAFLRLMRQAVEPANVKAWLFKVLRNEALDRSRSLRRRNRRERGSARADWFEAPAVDLLDAAAAALALQSLPASQREVIVLRIWAQMTLKEVAAITGVAVSTVFDQYRAGLNALRDHMGVPCKNLNDLTKPSRPCPRPSAK